MKETLEEKKARVKKILSRLCKAYGPGKCALKHSNPLELLVAVILSAQCTDKRVNLVTPALFKKYHTAQDYARADAGTFEQEIRSTGFYKNKAKNILACAKEIVAKHDSRVPSSMEELVRLPGVGRKTANAVLGNAFGVPGICVDTHMIRINRKLGLTKNTDPEKIEFDLVPLVPQKEWTNYSHQIIHHGRVRCIARRPDCANCVIHDLCPSREDKPSLRAPQGRSNLRSGIASSLPTEGTVKGTLISPDASGVRASSSRLRRQSSQ